MAGSIIPRGERVWLVRVFQGRDASGKRIYHNHTVHGNKKDAQTYLNGVLRERDLGQFHQADSVVGVLLDALLDDYEANDKSFEWVSQVVRVHLRPFFGAMKGSEVGSDDLQRYIAARRKPSERTLENGKKRKAAPGANGTINRELALLRRAFNLGRKSTPPLIASVPNFPKLAESAPRKGFFEHDAFVAVRRELPEEIRPVISFAYYTGCRKAEILGLRWNQVDLSERIVRLEPGETKNDEGRTIFLTAELYEILSMQRQQRDQLFPKSPWVFSRGGELIKNFRKAWDNACIAAGLVNDSGEPEKLFHDLRRTGVRNLVRAGVPERVAMMISGHKTRSVFDRYNIVSESDLKEAARKLGDYVARKEAEPERHTPGTHSNTEQIN